MPRDSKWKFFEGQDLGINLEGKVYYATKSFSHLRIKNLFKSTGVKETDMERFPNLRKAKKELPRLMKEHMDKYLEGRRPAGEGKTVAEVIEEIHRTETPGKREGTQANRELYFRKIRDDMCLGQMPMDRITLSLWTSRLAAERAKGKRTTFFDYMKNMNILMRYAYEQKYVSHLISFPNPDAKKETGTVLRTEEIRQLYNVMGDTTRDQFVLSYECCMRLREVLYLTWDRVDLESGEITLRAQDVKTGSKTGRGRTFIMTANALQRLRTRKANQVPTSPYVFPSRTGKGPVDANTTAWENAKAAVLKVNPAFQHWVRWHDLRHTAISRMLLELGMNIVKVSEYVGTSVMTLQRVYLHSKAEHTRSVTEGLRISDSE